MKKQSAPPHVHLKASFTVIFFSSLVFSFYFCKTNKKLLIRKKPSLNYLAKTDYKQNWIQNKVII